jgi:hypothetical protein
VNKKIVVPEGMLKAAIASHNDAVLKGNTPLVRDALEAALRWLAENPIVPTTEQVLAVRRACGETHTALTEKAKPLFAEWQRRMFLAPEPEVPEEIKDLLDPLDPYPYKSVHNPQVLEAYRRGKESR